MEIHGARKEGSGVELRPDRKADSRSHTMVFLCMSLEVVVLIIHRSRKTHTVCVGTGAETPFCSDPGWCAVATCVDSASVVSGLPPDGTVTSSSPGMDDS